MFRDFGRRLQRDVKALVDGRIAGSETKSGGLMKVRRALPPIIGSSLIAL